MRGRHAPPGRQLDGDMGSNLTNATFVALFQYTIPSSDNDYLYSV